MSLRIWRSPYSRFGKLSKVPDDRLDETVTAVKVYDDAALRGIVDSGFNAIWVHGILRNMVRTDVFPGLGRRSARHRSAMRTLIERAGRFGIRVMVYMQPPRALPIDDPFWHRHPDVGGHEVDFMTCDEFKVRYRSLCTSTADVQRYLREAAARLASELPGLGGVILITASEFPSHCWARCGAMVDVSGNLGPYNPPACPRCADRAPGDIVAEIVRQVRDGIRSQSRRTRVVAWNWSWTAYEKAPCTGIIAQLPKDVVVMADFERGGARTIMGKPRVMDEYSLSYAGPSASFKRTRDDAQARGLEVMAKLQLGTTHELATVPNLPLIGSLHAKAVGMREAGVNDFMGCWNFGNMATVNTAAFNRFMLADRLPGRKQALTAFAADYFPGCDAAPVVEAWEQFGEAMQCYPFSIPFLYNSPINYTLAYPLKPAPLTGRPIGRSWLMDRRGDDLTPSLDPYSLAEVIRGLGALARQWKRSIGLLQKGLKSCDSETARAELDNARVCYHVFRSAWNTYRVYRLRLKWSDSQRAAFSRIAADELANMEAVLPIVQRDPRFGYHSECQASMFDAASIRGKLCALKRMHENDARIQPARKCQHNSIHNKGYL